MRGEEAQNGENGFGKSRKFTLRKDGVKKQIPRAARTGLRRVFQQPVNCRTRVASVPSNCTPWNQDPRNRPALDTARVFGCFTPRYRYPSSWDGLRLRACGSSALLISPPPPGVRGSPVFDFLTQSKPIVLKHR